MSDPCGVLILCRRKEDSHEAPGHHVEHRALVVIKRTGNSSGGNDRKVIAYFCVIKDAFIWLDPIVIEYLPCEWIVALTQYRSCCREVIFRQSARIRARISDDFVLLVKRLGDLQGAFCREAEAIVRFALQGRKIIQLRRNLCGWLLLLEFDDAILAAALSLNGFGDFAVPQSRRGAMLFPEGAVCGIQAPLGIREIQL